jgi:hypothetical protein
VESAPSRAALYARYPARSRRSANCRSPPILRHSLMACSPSVEIASKTVSGSANALEGREDHRGPAIIDYVVSEASGLVRSSFLVPPLARRAIGPAFRGLRAISKVEMAGDVLNFRVSRKLSGDVGKSQPPCVSLRLE